MDSFLSKIDPPKPPRQITGPTVPPPDAYTKKALEDEIQELANTAKNGRNHQLNISALKLGGLPLDRDDLRNQLIDACHKNGLVDEDGIISVEKTIDSAFRKADSQPPRTVPERTPRLSIVGGGNGAQNPADTAGIGHSAEMDNPFGEFPPIDAGDWLYSADDTIVELWGQGDDILWAEGEALLIAGNQGCGKSTLAGQLIRAQLGLQSTVLDLPVAPIEKPILVLAMDRPRQLRRSMRRQFPEEERDLFRGRLLIRPGPPIMDMAVDPTLLARMAEAVGAGVVYVDSLKDAAVGLSTDEVGALYNRARQSLLATGANVCELHHVKKFDANANTGAGSVSEVYGSTWITSGAGSVLTLSGEPGDLEIRFRQVKSPANEQGPWRLHLDPDKGSFSVRSIDLLVSVRNAGAEGLSAEDAAAQIYERRRPSGSEIKKAERQLDKLVGKGLLRRIEGRGGAGVWFLTENRFGDPVQQVSGDLF